jgi:hypothetical protein
VPEAPQATVPPSRAALAANRDLPYVGSSSIAIGCGCRAHESRVANCLLALIGASWQSVIRIHELLGTLEQGALRASDLIEPYPADIRRMGSYRQRRLGASRPNLVVTFASVGPGRLSVYLSHLPGACTAKPKEEPSK